VLRSKGDALREQVCQWLLEWFSDRRKTSREAKNEILNINYFDAGLLTSLEVIEFVTEIEEKFAVRFSEADFQDSRFVTMSGLSDLILERAAQTRNCR
jgi:acyl carrier protein